jgi:DUF1365 family protein
MVEGPALYVGRLRHRRFRPRPHAFTYHLFMALVDVDHIDEQMRMSRLTSVNRFNWASFDDRDHLGDPILPLRQRLTADAATHGLVLPSGPVYLLTHLRYLGYNFNPISFYYCFDASGKLGLIAAEVHSTFGELRTYWLPLSDAEATPNAFRCRARKSMHVSPFMAMDLHYEFVLTPPGSTLVAHMHTIDPADAVAGPFFDATLTLDRRPWTPRELHRVLGRHPWMTAKVIAAIHWQALRLWLKGVPGYPHPKGAAGRKKSRREAEA